MTFLSEETRALVLEIAQILKSRNETIAVSEAACGGILSAYLVSIPGASKFYHGGTLVYSLKSKLKLSGWSQEEILNYTGPSSYSVRKQARNLKVELGSTYVLCESGFAGPSVEIEQYAQEKKRQKLNDDETYKNGNSSSLSRKNSGDDDNNDNENETEKPSENEIRSQKDAGGVDADVDDAGKVGTVYFAISGPDGEKTIKRNTGIEDRVRNMEEFAKIGLCFFLDELKAKAGDEKLEN